MFVVYLVTFQNVPVSPIAAPNIFVSPVAQNTPVSSLAMQYRKFLFHLAILQTIPVSPVAVYSIPLSSGSPSEYSCSPISARNIPTSPVAQNIPVSPGYPTDQACPTRRP
jgi:hypothetical protein